MPARLLFAIVSGIALWSAFPSAGLWWLAAPGVAGLALATCGAGVWRGALLGLVAGLGMFAPMLHWSSTYAGDLAWWGLASATAVYPAVMAGVTAYLQGRGSAARVAPVGVALAWVVMETARSYTPFGGWQWGRLGFSQAEAPTVGVAALLGVPGVTFVVALAGGFLAVGVRRLRHRRVGSGAAAVLATLALVLAPVLVPLPTSGRPVDVLAVQANIPEDFTRTLSAPRGTILQRYIDATASAVERQDIQQPDVVLWPESSLDLSPTGPRGEEARTALRQAAEGAGAPLLAGGVVSGPDGPENTAFLVQPGEGIVDRYQKVHLAPFGEFIPMRSVFARLSPLTGMIADYSPGQEPGVLSVPTAGAGQLQLGVTICFEIVVDAAVRDTVQAGAELLVVPTNNAWFGRGDESVQQLGSARVMAVATGRSVVQISNVGESALITPDGAVTQRTGLFTADLLSGTLPARDELTLAVRWGLWPERVAAAALGVLLLMRAAGGRRGRVRVP